MKKTSPVQLVIMLFVIRAYLSVTYGVSENRINIVLSMVSILVAAAVQLLLIVPPLVFSARYPDKNILQVAFMKSKLLGILLSVSYATFFVQEALRSMGIFSYFLKNQFLDYLPVPILIAALGVASFYGSRMGIQALARAAAVGVFLFSVIFLIIIFGVTGEYDFYNIQLATPVPDSVAKAFIKDVSDKVGRSSELVALPFLLPCTNSRKTSATLSYTGIKLVVMELMVFYSALILGEYASKLSLPFYTLSTYAKTSIIERYDSIYMLVWTIGTFIKTAIMMYLVSECLKNTGFRFSSQASLLAPTLTAIVLAVLNKWDCALFRSAPTVIVVFLSSVIPLILCFQKRQDRKKPHFREGELI